MFTVRRRLVWTAAVVGLGMLVGAGPAGAAPVRGGAAAGLAGATCQRHALPTLGIGQSTLTGGDPSGRYLLGGEGGKPVIWVDGQPRLFPTDAVRTDGQVDLVDANSRGEIVGDRWTGGSGHQDTWLYRNGRFTILPPLTPGASTRPVGINERGDVAGSSFIDNVGWRAVVWPAGDPTAVRALTVPGHPEVETSAVGLDEDGTVLGLLDGAPPVYPYVWPARGAPYALAWPSDGVVLWLTAIRNGFVVGNAQIGDTPVGWMWDLRTRRGHATSTEFPSSLSVNRWGTVGAADALIHRDGRAVRLGYGELPYVMTDRGFAAGMSGDPYFGTPSIWTGC